MATPRDVEFRFVTDADARSGTLIAGLAAFGLAGLTAVEYLADALSLEPAGHVAVDGLPTITPFEDGRPRRPIRLYSGPDRDVTVMVAEPSVPPAAADPFGDAVVDWAERSGVEDVAVLAGVPLAHGPDEHRAFFVATDDYRERHLVESDVTPMGQGFLDGPNAAVVRRGMDAPTGACVYVTPVHAQSPDADAAVRLVEAVADVHGLDVDAGPLREFAAAVQQHYAGLAERLAERETEASADRMYM
ncbi:MAG: proteasome assembly chaperone family protein [Haloferacaceae archaeon]